MTPVTTLQALLGAFSCISICLAYVADTVPPHHRAASFGFAMAAFSSGVVAGPLAGGLLTPLAAAWVGAGGVLFNALYTIFFVRESLPYAARKQVSINIDSLCMIMLLGPHAAICPCFCPALQVLAGRLGL